VTENNVPPIETTEDNKLVRMDTGEVYDPGNEFHMTQLLGETADTYAEAKAAHDLATLELAEFDRAVLSEQEDRDPIVARQMEAEIVMHHIEQTFSALFPERPPGFMAKIDAGSVLVTYGKARAKRPPLSHYKKPEALMELQAAMIAAALTAADKGKDLDGLVADMVECVRQWMDPEPTYGDSPPPKFTVRGPKS
jgi:hypothetical protein